MTDDVMSDPDLIVTYAMPFGAQLVALTIVSLRALPADVSLSAKLWVNGAPTPIVITIAGGSGAGAAGFASGLEPIALLGKVEVQLIAANSGPDFVLPTDLQATACLGGIFT
jgi:hypothetical protein